MGRTCWEQNENPGLDPFKVNVMFDTEHTEEKKKQTAEVVCLFPCGWWCAGITLQLSLTLPELMGTFAVTSLQMGEAFSEEINYQKEKLEKGSQTNFVKKKKTTQKAILSSPDSKIPAQLPAFCAHTALLWVSDSFASPYKF